MVDGGGYDPKRRDAPARSAPAQAYTAPVQTYSAPAAPMTSAPASKWEPCTFIIVSLYLSLARFCVLSVDCSVSFTNSCASSHCLVIFFFHSHSHSWQMAEDIIRNSAAHPCRAARLRRAARRQSLTLPPRWQRLLGCPCRVPQSGSPVSCSLSLAHLLFCCAQCAVFLSVSCLLFGKPITLTFLRAGAPSLTRCLYVMLVHLFVHTRAHM